MARIHTLPTEEAHKIAAGEVVERPASVVKELMENALDAGADAITLDVHDGGRQRIRITDNGHGMDSHDMHMCVQQHTTSKITSCQQVPTITSFGFRGEALASICHVSTLTITSQEPSAQAGYTITVQQGQITHEQVTARAPGTEIIVDDLFDNVPARKKFLKKRETEWRAIYQQCLAFASAHPHCAFTIYHDGRSVLQCSHASDHQERIGQVHDRFFARQFTPCTYTDDRNGIHVTGVITHPEYHRYDRTMLTCFVNNRWVKNHRLGQAIIKGYADILPPRRFPAGYIFISVPNEEVDINVHPRKEEVHFMHPRCVERAIEHAVRTTLEAYTREQLATHTHTSTASSAPETSTSSTYRPSLQHASDATTRAPRHRDHGSYASHHVLHQTASTSNHPEAARESSTSLAQEAHRGPTDDTARSPDSPSSRGSAQVQQTASPHYQQHIHEGESELESTASEATPTYHIIGQMQQMYIILEQRNGMTIIDQHAAHERVLYDTFMENTQITTTQLMFPYRIALRQADCDHIMQHADLLHAYGVSIDRFDATHIIITHVPVALNTIDWSDMLQELVSTLPANQTHAYDEGSYVYHEVCATMACKAAIKAGDQLSHAEMQAIVEKLYTCKHPMTCPHGRPTIITLSDDDLQRKFKRIT